MWVYDSQIGLLTIVLQGNGKYAFWYDGETYDEWDTPEGAADDIGRHRTGCGEWDYICEQPDDPTNLSEWNKVNHLS